MVQSHPRAVPMAGEAVLDIGGASVVLGWAAATHPGLVRTSNQDRFKVRGGAFVLCDGMGGHQGGERASEIAAELMSSAWGEDGVTVAQIPAALDTANAAILDAVRDEPRLDGMGTTLVALVLADNGGTPAFVGVNVGDSRLYADESASWRQVSHDHSVVQELMDAGALDVDDVAGHPDRHVITRALGSEPAPAADTWVFEAREGVRFLLTSDGVHGEFDVDGALQSLGGSSPTDCVEQLAAAALESGGHDNLTVVAVEVRSVSTPVDGEVDEDTLPRSAIAQVRAESTDKPRRSRLRKVVPGRRTGAS